MNDLISISIFQILPASISWSYGNYIFTNYLQPFICNYDVECPYQNSQIMASFYVLKCAMVGVFYGLGGTIGACLYVILKDCIVYRKRLSPQIISLIYKDICYLLCSLIVIGFLWLPFRDSGNVLGGDLWNYDDVIPTEIFTFLKIFMNGILFIFISTLFFQIFSQYVCKATWSKSIVSFQYGFSNFGMYIGVSLFHYMLFHYKLNLYFPMSLVISSLCRGIFAFLFSLLPLFYIPIENCTKNNFLNCIKNKKRQTNVNRLIIGNESSLAPLYIREPK